MIHLLTAADYREGMAPVRASRRAMASVHGTGPMALTLVLLLGNMLVIWLSFVASSPTWSDAWEYPRCRND